MVLVGEKSLQQQVLQAVPENGVVLAPFETVARSRTENVSEEFCVVNIRNYSVDSHSNLKPCHSERYHFVILSNVEGSRRNAPALMPL
jgi:hypothetical protein